MKHRNIANLLASLALIVALAASTLSASILPAQALGIQEESAPPAEYVQAERILWFETAPNLEELVAALTGLGAEISQVSPNGDLVVARFASEAEAQSSAQALASLPGAPQVSYNEIFHTNNEIRPLESAPAQAESAKEMAAPEFNVNDGRRTGQWYLDKILMPQAPNPTNPGVCVVIVDSGVDYLHPDLDPLNPDTTPVYGTQKVYLGPDFVDNDNDPMDEYGSGTFLAGVVAARTNNTEGVAAVSPASSVIAVRVLDQTGAGTRANLLSGIQWAGNATPTMCGDQKPRIILLGVSPYTTTNSAELSAIKTIQGKGKLIIAPAGDYEPTSPVVGGKPGTVKTYPAGYLSADGTTLTSLIAVAATDQFDNRYYRSRYTKTGTSAWVDIAAPGYELDSLTLRAVEPGYARQDGTPNAAAVVAGVAAQVWAKFPALKAAEVRSRLISTGDSGKGFDVTIKRVNLYRALAGTKRTIQGQVFNMSNGTPMEGATVVIKNATGQTVCSNLLTTVEGFYSCFVPADAKYTVTASKAGYITDKRTFSLIGRVFNANIGLSRRTSTTGDWAVNLYWPGFQPFEKVGREEDLWFAYGSPAQCASAYLPGSDPDFTFSPDSYLENSLENGRINKAHGGSVQVWAVVLVGNSWYGKTIAATNTVVTLYKTNTLVKSIKAPTTPITAGYVYWHVGTINLDAGTFATVNKIYPKSASQRPACIP